MVYERTAFIYKRDGLPETARFPEPDVPIDEWES